MDALQILPTPAGLTLAAVAIALGAPLFSDGLRSLRLRRHLRSLRETPLTASTHGFAHVRGAVALESPLFSPLSGRPCAGFQLEVTGEEHPVRHVIEERRPFRVVEGEVLARIPSAAGRWVLGAGATRRITPDDRLSENLRALLGRVAEVNWLRRTGVTLVLTERALFAGHECHVVGTARSGLAVAYVEALEQAKTGTDDAVPFTIATEAVSDGTGEIRPQVAFTPGEHLEFLLVCDSVPPAERLRISPWRLIGVALGPLLSLAGVLYLAAVADAMRAAGRL